MVRAARLSKQTLSRQLLLEVLEDRTVPANLVAGYGRLPLAFEPNVGQADASIDYLTQGGGYRLNLSASGATFTFGEGAKKLEVGWQIKGGNSDASALAADPLITRVNYLRGDDSSTLLTNIPTYGEVLFDNVYPGIDVKYHGNQSRLEYDFLLEARADPRAIRLKMDGATGLRVDVMGNLVIYTPAGNLVQQKPVVYQMDHGVRRNVAARFQLFGQNEVGFRLGRYDSTLPLVIDPTLSYATFMQKPIVGIAIDSAGAQLFLTGDGMVGKLNTTGSALLYQTYLGSSGTDLAIDAAGDAYVFGNGTVATTANAYQQTPGPSFFTVLNAAGSSMIYSTYLPLIAPNFYGNFAGGHGGSISVDPTGNAILFAKADPGLDFGAAAYQATAVNSSLCLLKIDPNLSGAASLVYGTYFGDASNNSSPGTVTTDAAGMVYLTGTTNSANFPTTAGAFQQTLGGSGDLYVAKFNPSQSGSASLVYSTYLGGSHSDGRGGMYAFWWSNSKTGVQSNTGAGPAIAVDASGNAYVTGGTFSADFPVTAGAYKTSSGLTTNSPPVAFVSKLNAAGSGLIYSTFLGSVSSSAWENQGGTDIVVDSSGNAYVTGVTGPNFQTTSGAPQRNYKSTGDSFVAKINASGSSLLFGTFLGGTGTDVPYAIARDGQGNVYVAGVTGSWKDFPVTRGAYLTSYGFYGLYIGFAAKISGI